MNAWMHDCSPRAWGPGQRWAQAVSLHTDSHFHDLDAQDSFPIFCFCGGKVDFSQQDEQVCTFLCL